MKFKLGILFLTTILLGSCTQKLETPDNLITTSIAAIETKIANQDSFVMYFSSGSCSFCLQYKENAIHYLDENTTKTLYRVDVNTMVSTKKSEYALIIYNLLGASYYTANGYVATSLYIPATLKYVAGVATVAEIGVLEQTEFATWLTD